MPTKSDVQGTLVQPPALNYYELLELPLWEADAEIIAAAADRQLARLTAHTSGPQAAVAGRLIAIVAGAKLCLTDPRRKAVYDAALRYRMDPGAVQTAKPLPWKWIAAAASVLLFIGLIFLLRALVS